jgi:hypothetical protein
MATTQGLRAFAPLNSLEVTPLVGLDSGCNFYLIEFQVLILSRTFDRCPKTSLDQQRPFSRLPHESKLVQTLPARATTF